MLNKAYAIDRTSIQVESVLILLVLENLGGTSFLTLGEVNALLCIHLAQHLFPDNL